MVLITIIGQEDFQSHTVGTKPPTHGTIKERLENMELNPTKEQFYEIAKIIDNGFIGSMDTFSFDRHLTGFNLLNTRKCDDASVVKIWHDFNKIIKIERLGSDTDGWQPIQQETMSKVMHYINSELNKA